MKAGSFREIEIDQDLHRSPCAGGPQMLQLGKNIFIHFGPGPQNL